MNITVSKALHISLLLLSIVVLPTSGEKPTNFNNNSSSNNNTHGSEVIHDYPKNISKLLSSAQQVTVLVVGGGVSGLSTVETFLNNGVEDVLLLEATDRLGGRVQTIRQDGVLVEAGAEWIHGDQQNPVYGIAESLDALGENVPDDEWEWMLVSGNGKVQDEQSISNWERILEIESDSETDMLPYFNLSLGQYYIDKFQVAFGDNDNSTENKALLNALEVRKMNSDGSNSWFDLTAREAVSYLDYGEDNQWKDGYDTLITHISSKIPGSKIKISNPVSEVYWDQDSHDGVLVVTSNGRSFLAQYVVFTTSVAYLQKNHQHIFSPSLPKPYIEALEGISLGVTDKIQIGWDAPWWSNTSEPFAVNILWEIMDLPKEMSWLYGVVEVFTVYQQPTVLQMFITGDNAKAMENLTEDQVKTHVMHFLERIMKKSVPRPKFFNRSQWGLNPWTLGSYGSYITVAGDKGGLHNRKPLSKPLYNSQGKMVLGWAGEHTHDTRHSCVDGARETGIREATKILTLMGVAKAAAMTLPVAPTMILVLVMFLLFIE